MAQYRIVNKQGTFKPQYRKWICWKDVPVLTEYSGIGTEIWARQNLFQFVATTKFKGIAVVMNSAGNGRFVFKELSKSAC